MKPVQGPRRRKQKGKTKAQGRAIPPISTSRSVPRSLLNPANLVSVDATRSFDDLPGLRPNNALTPLKPFKYKPQDASEDRSMDTYDEYEHRKRIRKSQESRREIQGSEHVFTRAMGWWHNQQVQTALQEQDFNQALGAIRAGQSTFGAVDADFRPASGRDIQIQPLDVTDYDSCVDLLGKGIEFLFAPNSATHAHISIAFAVKAESKYSLNPALKGTLDKKVEPTDTNAPDSVYRIASQGMVEGGSSVESVIQESRTIPTKCAWRENYSWLETTSTVALDEVKTSMEKLEHQNSAAMMLQNTVRTYKCLRHLELQRVKKVGGQIWDDVFFRTVTNRNMLVLSISKITKRLDKLLGDGAHGNRYATMTYQFMRGIIAVVEDKKMVSGALHRLEESLQRTNPERRAKLEKAAKRAGSPTKCNARVETGDAHHEEHLVEELVMFLENACQAITAPSEGAPKLDSDAATALLNPETLKLVVDCMTEYSDDREILCNGLTLLHRIHELIKLKKADNTSGGSSPSAMPPPLNLGAVSGGGPASPSPKKAPMGLAGMGFRTPSFGKKKLLAALAGGGLKSETGDALLTHSASKRMLELDLEQQFVNKMQMCGGIGAIAGALAFRPLLPVAPVTHGIELLMFVAKRLVKAKSGDSIREVAAKGLVAKLFTQYHIVDTIIPLIGHFSRGVCSVSGLLPAMRLASLCISYEQASAPEEEEEEEEEEEGDAAEEERADMSAMIEFDGVRGFQSLSLPATAQPLFFRVPTLLSLTDDDASKLVRLGIKSTVEVRPPFAASILVEEEEENEALTEMVGGVGIDRVDDGEEHQSSLIVEDQATLDPLTRAGVGHHEKFTLPSMRPTDMLRMVTAGPAGFAEFTRTMLETDQRIIFELMSHFTLESHLPCIIQGGGGHKSAAKVTAELKQAGSQPRPLSAASKKNAYPPGCNYGEGKEAIGVLTILMLMLTDATPEYILEQWCKTGNEGEPGASEEMRLATKSQAFEMTLRPILQEDGATMAEVRDIRLGITAWTCSVATGRAVMDEINDRFGGAASYLEDVLNLETRQVDTLRALVGRGHASRGGWLRRGSVLERKAVRGKELFGATLAVLEEFDGFAPKEGEQFDSDDEDEDDDMADNDKGMDATFKLLRVRVAILQSVSRFLPTLQRQCADKVNARAKSRAKEEKNHHAGKKDFHAEGGEDTQVLSNIIHLMLKESEVQVFALQTMSLHHGVGGESGTGSMHLDMIDKLESVFSNLMGVLENTINQRTLDPTEVVLFVKDFLHMRCRQRHAGRRGSAAIVQVRVRSYAIPLLTIIQLKLAMLRKKRPTDRLIQPTTP
jgi:hypothetical protein